MTQEDIEQFVKDFRSWYYNQSSDVTGAEISGYLERELVKPHLLQQQDEGAYPTVNTSTSKNVESLGGIPKSAAFKRIANSYTDSQSELSYYKKLAEAAERVIKFSKPEGPTWLGILTKDSYSQAYKAYQSLKQLKAEETKNKTP